MRARLLAPALLLVAGVACKKNDGDKPGSAAARQGSAAAATPGSVVAPGSAAAEGKPVVAAGPHVLVLDKLGMAVDAPGCAEVTTLDEHSQSVTPSDPSCVVPFPGAVFTIDSPDAGKSFDADVKLAGTTAEVTRKEKTDSGWILETKDGEGARYTQRYKVGGHVISCAAQLGDDAAKNDAVKKICASARPK